MIKKEWHTIVPDDDSQKAVMSGINLAKSGRVDIARKIFLQQIENLKNRGAQAVILGCTEIPAVLNKDPILIDCNLALANRCVRWFHATYSGFVKQVGGNVFYPVIQNRPNNEFNGDVF